MQNIQFFLKIRGITKKVSARSERKMALVVKGFNSLFPKVKRLCHQMEIHYCPNWIYGIFIIRKIRIWQKGLILGSLFLNQLFFSSSSGSKVTYVTCYCCYWLYICLVYHEHPVLKPGAVGAGGGLCGGRGLPLHVAGEGLRGPGGEQTYSLN